MLHISARDRKTRFRMIPQAHWVPDQMASHCQFTSKRPCSVKFSLFQRRHHCRKYVDHLWNVNEWFIYGCLFVDVESLSANATVVIAFHCLQSHLRHHNGPVCATSAFVTLS